MKKLIGLTGRAGSGKSTVAKMIESHFFDEDFCSTWSLAYPMKIMLKSAGLFPEDVLFGPSELRSTPHPVLGFTARHALQTLGTSWGRGLHSDIWIHLTINGCKNYAGISIISDVRFLNEAHAIREAGGEVWMLTRGGLEGEAGQHPSETECMSSEMAALCTRRIRNDDWSRDELRQYVHSALVADGLVDL